LQLIQLKLSMKLPEDPSIRYIGFVDEGDKLSAMAGAVSVVQPSRMESFSIVTIEAFSVGTPVIANAQSRVLADHCRKANAGLYYGDFEEFEEILTLLLNDRNLGRSLGRNGQAYVKDNYGWNRLLPKYELVFRSSARPAREPRGARGRAPVASATAAPHEPTTDMVATETCRFSSPTESRSKLARRAQAPSPLGRAGAGRADGGVRRARAGGNGLRGRGRGAGGKGHPRRVARFLSRARAT
jgi:hypothetical protein